MKFKDLTGQRFGKLLVIGKANNKKTWTCFNCVCDCGKSTIKYSTHLIRGLVNSCGCGHPKGESMYNYKGCGEITGNRWYTISHRSNRTSRKDLPFEITIEYAWSLFLKQERKCALTGIILIFSDNKKDNTSSLDRIDSAKGYTEDNVQWVHKDINRMKNIFEQEYFINMCKLVANR